MIGVFGIGYHFPVVVCICTLGGVVHVFIVHGSTLTAHVHVQIHL